MLNLKSCIALFCIICFFTSLSFAQNVKITGSISDEETGKPLEGVNITIVGTNIGTSSNSLGNFSFTAFSEKKIQLKVSMIGYQPAVKTIQPTINSEENIVNFGLKPTVLVMGPVTITGEYERNLLENPTIESPGLELSTSNLQAREIKQQGAKTVIEALQYLPGSLVETRGRKVKQFFSIRGQRYPYPEYAINGAWQREFHELPYFFSTADIENIKVVRSSAALLTGINGMAGVINIITKEYETPTTTREIEYGSFGSYRGHISHGAKKGPVYYAAGLGTNYTNGPEGLNAKEGMTNFYSSLKWIANPKTTVRYNLFFLNGHRELRLAQAPAAKRFLTEISRYDPYRSTLTNLKINYKMSARATAELLLYYSQRDPEYIVEDKEANVSSRLNERDYEWGVHLLQSCALSEKNVLRFGGLYNNWVAPNGKRFYVGRRNDLSTFSGVVVDEHRFDRFTVDAGLRWSKTFIDEYGAFNIEGSGNKFKKVSAIKEEWEPGVFQSSVGISYPLFNLTSLHLNAAVGQIKPRNGSLDVDFEKPENETRMKLDVGIRSISTSFGKIALVGFLTRQKNAIVLSGDGYETNNRFLELYLNRDQDQYGVELDARMTSLFSSLQGFVNVLAMKTKVKAEQGFVENKEYPEMISSVGLYYQKKNCDITVMTKYVSYFENTRFAAPASDGKVYPQPLGDFFIADLNVGYTIGKNYNTRFYVEIKNIMDKLYSTVVGYPDFGRTILGGLRQSF